jgi:hypothetical protein
MLTATQAPATMQPDAQVAPGGQLVNYAEEYRCPQCDGLIHPACVAGRTLNPRAIEPTRRRVAVWCDHCRKGFASVFRLREDRLVQVDAVIVLDGEALAELHRAIAKVRGERFLDDVATTPTAAVVTPEEITALAPTAHDRPAVEQLDTDCDASAARADEPSSAAAAAEPERTIDRSESQEIPEFD